MGHGSGLLVVVRTTQCPVGGVDDGAEATPRQHTLVAHLPSPGNV
jgi:hypothetical protein